MLAFNALYMSFDATGEKEKKSNNFSKDWKKKYFQSYKQIHGLELKISNPLRL